jgi:hypothetical protein
MTGRPFQPGNKAARGRRSPARTTEALLARADDLLRDSGETREALDFAAEAVLRIIQASSKGDLEASRWLVERFFPLEREIVVKRGRFPSPTKKPTEYLDALVRAVGRGELTTAQAARLANIAAPYARDEFLRDTLERIARLEERVAQMRPSLRVVE